MTRFERQQRLLALVHERPGIRVLELARLLDVSPGTVRNDLILLARAGQVVRVRGGAAPKSEGPGPSSPFAAQARVNRAAKLRIARWAANLVQDGDSILLDASTTVYHLVPFLQDRRHLTVVTNGLEVARALAQNPTNTVILLGGVLSADGASVTGSVSEGLLADLHIRTAFVSCTGLTPEAGLTEADIRQAEFKRKMIAGVSRVVALVDSSKFGRVSLAPFAQLSQIAQILTDEDLAPVWLERLRDTPLVLSLCGESRVSSIGPGPAQATRYRIGFANLSEQLSYAVDVRRSVERAAQEAGNVDLVLADNNLDARAALAVADSLIAEGVDLAIEYQLHYEAGDVIMSRFQDAGIPVIAVDIPMVGATFFGVDNYRAGLVAGMALGNWVRKHWDGRVDLLVAIERASAGPLPAARMRGQIDGVESVLGEMPADRVVWVDAGEDWQTTGDQVAGLLADQPRGRRLAFVTFSDAVAMAVVAAGRGLGREHDMAVVSQGADRRVCDEMQRPGSPLVGATAFYPDRYGDQLIALALKILRGEPVPPAVYIEHTFVARDPELLPQGASQTVTQRT